ncbi:EF-hand domain-containing family member C2 isoform 1-T1 [Synchiropus picturatus]
MLPTDKYHKSQHFDYSNGVPMMVGNKKPGIGGQPLTGQRVKRKYFLYPISQRSDMPTKAAIDKQIQMDKFHKSQHFDYTNGIPMMVGSIKPGIGGEPLKGQKAKPKQSVYPKAQCNDLPSWVTFNKQALCFDAYFKEIVPYNQNELYRIRKCKIYFYLEDDTIQVMEPKSKNSGMKQGVFIHRQKIPLPPPNQGEFYNIYHFNINQEMELFARKFIITDCDPFTRNFFTKLGVRLNDRVDIPDDPYSKVRQQAEDRIMPRRPYERLDTMKQFMDHDRQVLRFYCLWDDSKTMFGDPRELILHYFLADDTIEIHEVYPPNSGRDVLPKFLRRSKLPKNAPTQMRQPGEVTDRTLLNVLTSSNQATHYILDSLKTGAVHEECYKDCDLMLGREVNVWGRKVILTECDDFTKHHYRTKYGIEDFTPVQYKSPPVPKPARLVPPYNGFGSEEDSLSSCQGLLPKPPRKDFCKFMEKDRCGLDSNVMSFNAKMVTTDEVDKERVFVISFFLSDDTISVFEHPRKNSGVIGGKFLQRGRVKKPGQELFKSKLSEYFTPQDLYVGATLSLNNRDFLLVEANEYTLNYMEQHAEEFPRADLGRIFHKIRSYAEERLREMRNFLAEKDPANSGYIGYETLRDKLLTLDPELTEHEVLVLCRCFLEQEKPQLEVDLLLAVAQDFLMKKSFQEFLGLSKAFALQDKKRTKVLSLKEMVTICKSCRLPLPEKLLNTLLDIFADGDKVDYTAFLAGINWEDNRTSAVTPKDTLQFAVNWRYDEDGIPEKKVNYFSLLRHIFGTEQINPSSREGEGLDATRTPDKLGPN